MKINNVEAFLMSYPMPEQIELPFWGGVRTILKRDAMLIKVSCDNGITGWAPGPAYERAKQEIEHQIKDFLIGKNPLQWASIQWLQDPSLLKTYHAVEIALMDAAAKYEGCPLSHLIGSPNRNKIKCYGSAGMYMSPEAYAEEAFAIMEMGFPAYKMRPGLGVEEDLRVVELMRKSTGSEFGLMIDAHTWWRMGNLNYNSSKITGLCEAISIYNPYWLEEPFLPTDHQAYANLKKSGIIPVASGEHEQTYAGFEDLARMNAVDFMQMDVCCQGGFQMGKQVFNLAANNQMKFAFHCWGTQLEVLASAHLGVCGDESVVEWLEYPCYSSTGRPGMYPFPLAAEIIKEPLELSNGYLQIPDRPGLGIDVNEEVIEKYPFIKGPWSFFHLKSPQSTIAVTGDHSLKWTKPA